jgi:hypothetical protein
MTSVKRDGSVFVNNRYAGQVTKSGYKWTAERWDTSAGGPAAPARYCEGGCGCRYGTEDADARECGCDGPCTEGAPEWYRAGGATGRGTLVPVGTGPFRTRFDAVNAIIEARQAEADKQPSWARIQYLKSLRDDNPAAPFDGFPTLELETEYYRLLGERYDPDGSHNLRDPAPAETPDTSRAQRLADLHNRTRDAITRLEDRLYQLRQKRSKQYGQAMRALPDGVLMQHDPKTGYITVCSPEPAPAKPRTLGEMSTEARQAVINRAAAQLQAELTANADAIGRVLNEFEAEPSTDEMIARLDDGGLPDDPHDSRTVREVYDAGLIDDADVRRMYQVHLSPEA